MSEQLAHSLTKLSERGQPRGDASVLAEAHRRIEAAPPSRPVRHTFAPAFAIAAIVLVTVAGLVTLRLVRRDPASVHEPTPVSTAQPTTTEPPAPVVGAADDVFDLALAPDGRLWAATATGVVVWDLATASPTVFTEADGLGGRSVDHIAVAGDGIAWAIGDSWLARYDGTWSPVGDDVVDADLLTPVGDVAIGPDGALWVAAGGPDALIRIDTDGATTYAVPEDERLATPWARSIAVGPDGIVWASTLESGVLAFDGEWQHFGVDDGLPSDVVGNVAVAPDGSVWVGGDGLHGEQTGDIPAGGILHYRDGSWTVYTTADGLLADGGTVTVDPTGDVWVVHSPLPEEFAEALGIELADGISLFDGTQWRQYATVDGRGPGVATPAGVLWLPSSQGITGFDGATTMHLTAGPEAVPLVAPAGEPVRLEPAEGLEPVRLLTSIGEIEFTTWVLPDDGDPPWRLTETDHGVIGDLPPDGTPASSPDGITWTEILLSAQPFGWSDQAAAYGNDLFIFLDGGVGRLEWDGGGWVEAEILPTPRVYRGAVGPGGVIAVGTNRISYWDGTEFTEASQPPDRTLYPEPSAGCSAPGWTGEGILAEFGPVVATDDGFVVLAARSEADWYKYPVCEPLVWQSTDGDVWTTSSDESPFGERAFVHDIAVVDGRIVAVGGVSPTEAAVWVSDDAIDWERADVDAAQLWQIAGGARGWIAIGNHESKQSADLGGDMWFSPDGLVWEGPFERPAGWADVGGFVGVAMLDDLIVGSGEQLNSVPAGSAGVVVGVFMDE